MSATEILVFAGELVLGCLGTLFLFAVVIKRFDGDDEDK